MNWADYGILAILVLSALVGLLRGFTREFFGLATWVLAIALCVWFGRDAVQWLAPHIATPVLRTAAAYGGLFLAGLLVGGVITAVLVARIRRSAFSSADRTMGAGIGLIRGVLVVGVAVLVARTMELNREPWWQQAALLAPGEVVADGIDVLVPDGWLAPLKPDALPSRTPSPGRSLPSAPAAAVPGV